MVKSYSCGNEESGNIIVLTVPASPCTEQIWHHKSIPITHRAAGSSGKARAEKNNVCMCCYNINFIQEWQVFYFLICVYLNYTASDMQPEQLLAFEHFKYLVSGWLGGRWIVGMSLWACVVGDFCLFV